MQPNQIVDHTIRQISFNNYRVRRANIETDCPICGAEMKFSVHAFKGMWGCFRCGATGTVRGRIAGEDRSRWASVRGLVSRSEEVLRSGPREGIREPTEGISEPLWRIAGTLGPLTRHEDRGRPLPGLVREAYEYAIHRGLSPVQIVDYRLSVRAFESRLYCPVWNHWDDLVFYTARSFDGSEPKTLEPPVNQKPLYGLHVQKYTPGPLFLVEGVFDHFATPRSVATLGTNLSGSQIRDLADTDPSWVGVLWDPDATAKAERAAALLWDFGFPACVVRLPVRIQKDPADLGVKAMRGLVDRLLRREPPRRLEVWKVSF